MRLILPALAAMVALLPVASANAGDLAYGPRPLELIDRMADGPLKDRLAACSTQTPKRSVFSIGHRGAPMQFPEHTVVSYEAAARMGAGILECDVTFTKDKELVCRHSQNDLHTTTNILASDLAGKCYAGFEPAAGAREASAECRTSDITLAEYQTLTGKRDTADKTATKVKAYLQGNASKRTDLEGAETGRLMTHAQSIALFRDLGAKFTPELKSPAVAMPFDGFSQADYAQKMIDEYKAAGVPASDVCVQSFNLEDVLYWIGQEPEFGKQAVFLDGRYRSGINANNPATFKPSMAELNAMGVNYIAPPMWMLVTLENGEIVPSAYSKSAKEAGLKIITWTLERSGPLSTGGGWYYQSVTDAIGGDGMMFELVDVLAQDVGVEGIFSDWPATVTYYANCVGTPAL